MCRVWFHSEVVMEHAKTKTEPRRSGTCVLLFKSHQAAQQPMTDSVHPPKFVVSVSEFANVC